MPTRFSPDSPKKSPNITLPESLLVEAKALDINISKATEIGVAKAVAECSAELWRKENQEAIASSNAFAEERPLPLCNAKMF